MSYLGRCITDSEELTNLLGNVTESKRLYSCTYEKKFLKNAEDQCSGLNHTEKVPGIYTNETECVEYSEDEHDAPFNKLFDIPFGIRKTGKNLK